MTHDTSITTKTVPATGCCPPFDPVPWPDKAVTWHDKPFVRDHVACLFHVPLNMGRKVRKDMRRIQAVRAETEQPLMLSDARSPWGADIFIEVQRAVPGATMDQISGTFLTRVFEGSFRQAGDWGRQMQDHVAAKGRTLQKLYFGYTTCPKCAKAYGKNYVVVFAKVETPAAVSKPA